jgi:uncharacterized membrane protein YhaH (DUF805 family)
MQLWRLVSTFHGRISRKSWWLAFALVVSATAAGSLVLDPGIWMADPPRPPSLALALWDLLLVVPMSAAAVKRFNDGNRPRWFGFALGVLGAALIVAEQLGFMVDPATSPAVHHAIFWCVAAIFALAFVDNGFLRGTDGPNRHGPDPLADQAP